MANWGKFLDVTRPGRNDSKGTREARARVDRLRAELFEACASAERMPTERNREQVEVTTEDLNRARVSLDMAITADQRARKRWADLAFSEDERRPKKPPPPPPPFPSLGSPVPSDATLGLYTICCLALAALVVGLTLFLAR